MKQVIVVGAGVAGLTAGVYARQSGCDVTVLEMHRIPGGNCTSWRREGYLFEGSLHWLTGSDHRQPMHQVWRTVGAIDNTTKIFRRDPFSVYIQKGQKACLYTDPDILKAHLLSLSPEDRKEIAALCRNIKRFTHMPMPVTDIKGVRGHEASGIPAAALLRMLPAALRVPRLGKLSVSDYISRFRSPLIRGLLQTVVGKEIAASSLFFTLGTLAAGDGGYLEGGSLPMAENMAKRLKALGGRIQYSTRVERVITENGKAVGVLVHGKRIPADAVIVTVDTHSAIDSLFDRPLEEAWANRMRSQTTPMACTFISFGVEADLSDLPESMTFALEQPFVCAGKEHHVISLTNYANYSGYAPKDCTALTAILMGDTYEYWKAHKQAGSYRGEKEKTAKQMMALLAQCIPQSAGKIAVVDVATPLTYERYCGAYHGSWMTAVGANGNMAPYPVTSQRFQHLYFAGQRMQPPGGLPVAAHSGRRAVQHLCRDMGVTFQGAVHPSN